MVISKLFRPADFFQTYNLLINSYNRYPISGQIKFKFLLTFDAGVSWFTVTISFKMRRGGVFTAHITNFKSSNR